VQPYRVESGTLHTPSEKSREAALELNDQGGLDPKKPRRHRSGLQVCSDRSQTVRVLIVDRDSMTSDLLANALTRDRQIQALGVRSADFLNLLANGIIHVVVIGATISHQTKNGFDLAQTVRKLHPTVSIVVLLDQSTPESVVNAFRSGARGVISRQQPVIEFLDCVERVRQGFIWAGKQETSLLLDAFCSIPIPRISTSECFPLTDRELQVVKCAATGKTNKAIASELSLSEHTVKNYLFRAFEKLGVSNRVELLYHLHGLPDALHPREI
jgi:two-component system, NarL family, nitrate/nitrite response regulator NarL